MALGWALDPKTAAFTREDKEIWTKAHRCRQTPCEGQVNVEAGTGVTQPQAKESQA